MLLQYYDVNKTEAGCDEAGRGPLAGPVFAAAVVWPESLQHEMLKDSKLLSKKNRLMLRDFIEANATSFAVAKISPEEIDKINILNASIKAMHKALELLDSEFDLILADGNRFKKYKNIEHKTIIKGDNKYMSIAAASILAKTYRDEYMIRADRIYPQYNWQNNKGYPTRQHIEAVKKFGITEFHRKSFCQKYLINQSLSFV
jgi:ribonuclease HII